MYIQQYVCISYHIYICIDVYASRKNQITIVFEVDESGDGGPLMFSCWSATSNGDMKDLDLLWKNTTSS